MPGAGREPYTSIVQQLGLPPGTQLSGRQLRKHFPQITHDALTPDADGDSRSAQQHAQLLPDTDGGPRSAQEQAPKPDAGPRSAGQGQGGAGGDGPAGADRSCQACRQVQWDSELGRMVLGKVRRV